MKKLADLAISSAALSAQQQSDLAALQLAQPLEEIGQLAFKLLIDQIEGKNAGDSPVIEVLKTKLIVRESSIRVK